MEEKIKHRNFPEMRFPFEIISHFFEYKTASGFDPVFYIYAQNEPGSLTPFKFNTAIYLFNEEIYELKTEGICIFKISF